jgi:hypothetical protein
MPEYERLRDATRIRVSEPRWAGDGAPRGAADADDDVPKEDRCDL